MVIVKVEGEVVVVLVGIDYKTFMVFCSKLNETKYAFDPGIYFLMKTNK